jgi:hypothetical protein
MTFRPRMNARTDLNRPLLPAGLAGGDILFKHASDGWISQRIRKGQAPHYQEAKQALLEAASKGEVELQRMPAEAEATDITHVAVAAGPDDVLEFDEGGASKWEIVAKSGRGFVRGGMNMPSRLGKKYEVYQCTHDGLWQNAIDKAALVWDLTHVTNAGTQQDKVQDKTPLTGSYGLKKMLNTAILRKRGPDVSLKYFETTLDDWLKAADKRNQGDRFANTNIQFFCSQFVLFCYLWAAAELQQSEKLGGLDYILGGKASVSPTELYTRIKSAGGGFFRYKGTLKTEGPAR